MNYFTLIAVSFVLFSCSSKDPQFCECLKAGEELNTFSSTLFEKEITPELKKEMEEKRSKKDLACKQYQEMSGEEMLKRKEACDEK